MIEKQELNIADALQTMRKVMQNDLEIAWSWHCNIACAIMEEGIIHGVANAAAARFMLMAFQVDTRPETYAAWVQESYNKSDKVEDATWETQI